MITTFRSKPTLLPGLIFSLLLGPLLLGLSGCAGSDAAPASYLLPSTTPAKQYPQTLAISVAPVGIAGHLDSEGIVMQLNDIEVYQARQHLWAEDIGEQLQQRLTQRLTLSLPRSQVVGKGQPMLGGVPVRDVRIRVSRFQGHNDGMALAEGQWQLLDGSGRLLKQVGFRVEQPLTEDGYPALVRALATAWDRVADQLAAELDRQG
ncbi:membrane integrity-associated transporter subunit PqiC [Oceanisphaera sediminis]|uniref:Membrane integrity-associated transporter subunit PqiC n=1 Tax=Oceanisphaera sediminis TaxID=981381 RepID=A0ABP7EQE6_9GAMM